MSTNNLGFEVREVRAVLQICVQWRRGGAAGSGGLVGSAFVRCGLLRFSHMGQCGNKISN